jgi:hypothetical protein
MLLIRELWIIEKRGAMVVLLEYMTHAPLGSLNSVGDVATEINAINHVSPRNWLATSHFVYSQTAR